MVHNKYFWFKEILSPEVCKDIIDLGLSEIKQAKKGKEIRECKQEVGKRNFFCPTSNKTQTLAQPQLYMSPLLTTSPSYLILKI